MKIKDTEPLTAAALAAMQELSKPGKANKATLRKIICTPRIEAIIGEFFPMQVQVLREARAKARKAVRP